MIAVSLTALATACSSSSPRARGLATSTTIVSDATLAARAALTAADLPRGFTAVAVHDPSAAEVAQSRSLATCVGASTALVDVRTPPGEVRRLFVDGNIHVVNTVHVFASSAAAAPRFDTYTRRTSAECLAALFKAQLNAQGTSQQPVQAGAISVSTIPMRIAADRHVAYRLTAPLRTRQAQVNYYVDLAVAVRGRTVVTLEAVDTGQPYGARPEAALLAKVFGRLTATS